MPGPVQHPDNTSAYAPLAHELIAQLGRIDALVTAVGTGGQSAGIEGVLRERFPGLRVVAVDTIGSTIFGQPDAPRLIRGLGSSIHPRNVAYELFDEVHWVAPGEAVWAARALADRADPAPTSRWCPSGWRPGARARSAPGLQHPNENESTSAPPGI